MKMGTNKAVIYFLHGDLHCTVLVGIDRNTSIPYFTKVVMFTLCNFYT